MNLFREIVESGEGKNSSYLIGSPGLNVFTLLGAVGPVRAAFQQNGRAFGVVGVTLFEVMANGSSVARGTMVSDNLPVSVCGGPTKLMVVSAGSAYVYDMNANTLTLINPANFLGPVSQGAYLGGFYLALITGTNQVQYSTLLDPTIFNLANYIQVSKFPDNLTSMWVVNDELWLKSPKKSIAYYVSGESANNPFGVISGGYFEYGTAAQFSDSILDNSLFWIGGDERGQAIAWRTQGYLSVRVSDHALEYAMQSYAKVSDAISYSYQEQGHTFWVVYFPTGGATWVYDLTTNKWHQRGFWDTTVGKFIAHRSQCHMFAFGKHLVGDWKTGTIYDMSLNYTNDFGNAIRRVRVSPHISDEGTMLTHKRLQIDLETGIGPQPPLVGVDGLTPRDPQLFLRYSDDGGRTWSNIRILNCGQTGKFKTRAVAYRLGASRDRVYEISMSDSIPWYITDGWVTAEPGYQRPTERYADTLKKQGL